MRGQTPLLSSNSTLWATPQDLFDKLNAEFRFTLDVCATHETAKCADYYTPEIDGLSQIWKGVCFMNPPYGKTIAAWIRKAYQSSLNGATVVCLLPARTDTRWFHDFCLLGELRWIKGRLRFSAHKNPATFPSMICIFRGHDAQ